MVRRPFPAIIVGMPALGMETKTVNRHRHMMALTVHAATLKRKLFTKKQNEKKKKYGRKLNIRGVYSYMYRSIMGVLSKEGHLHLAFYVRIFV